MCYLSTQRFHLFREHVATSLTHQICGIIIVIAPTDLCELLEEIT